ncbi:adenine deaminase [Salipaludibacillus keqinensis]|uniref:Adenine deaminase n=1 Tax=Salipaludibacillus keqinensis TaxID=2045207 RepID=A0A323T9F2_9BACI|nr:adenine deaminase [Salipaludibacillus keqinensis]PYZ92322.1 adenine deaminase [Salipaludibacillus keqinensis]
MGLTERIHVANKQKPADVVIKNGKIVNVFSLEIETGDVAISEGKIVGIGQYEGKEEVDADGKYIVPGLIDGHVHIESSMVSPSHFANVVVPHGVTTVVTDPHEIANVTGDKGIEFMLQDSEGIPLDALFMLPSCVPATPFENSGAVLTAEDLTPFYHHERVLGLAEVMDFPSTASAEKGMINKITDARTRGKFIDGHGAGLGEHAMNIYGTAGITTDHECTTVEEARDRLKKGLYVLIREGSGAKDLEALIPLVTEKNARRFLFCTDDKHLDELIEKGSIDDNVRLAIKNGLDPMLAIQLATLNAAECYGLKTKGAIAPGYEGDLLLVDDLHSFSITEVYKNGKQVAKDGRMISAKESNGRKDDSLLNTVHLPNVTKESLNISVSNSRKAHAIKLIPNSLVTEKIVVEPDVQEGAFIASVDKNLMKMAVIERHHHTGNIGLGFIQGLGFQSGSIALTVAHDSHNLVTAGTNDEDMLKAIKEVKSMKGGLVLVKDGEVVTSLSLTIAGLMSNRTVEEAYQGLKQLDEGLEKLGFTGDFNPFSALSFMCLPVIPELKLTDLGYFDGNEGKHISIQA